MTQRILRVPQAQAAQAREALLRLFCAAHGIIPVEVNGELRCPSFDPRTGVPSGTAVTNAACAEHVSAGPPFFVAFAVDVDEGGALEMLGLHHAQGSPKWQPLAASTLVVQTPTQGGSVTFPAASVRSLVEFPPPDAGPF